MLAKMLTAFRFNLSSGPADVTELGIDTRTRRRYSAMTVEPLSGMVDWTTVRNDGPFHPSSGVMGSPLWMIPPSSIQQLSPERLSSGR
jgi:hypothetical protein